MEKIAITNQKGGCGKTVTAVNLAGALSGLGKKVLFIDLDPQAHATSAFGIKIKESSQSIYALFEEFLKNQARAYLSSLAQRRYDSLWVVGSHLSLSTMEQKLAGMKDAILILSKALKREDLSEFDYIIIDTPPNLGFLTLNAVHAAARIIVPLDVSQFSLNGVSQIEEILELSRSVGFEKPQVNFLITLFDKRTNFAKSFLEQARGRFSGQMMQTVIRSNVKLREAAQKGEVIFEYEPQANGAKDYLTLARELAPGSEEESLHLQKSLVAPFSPHTFFRLYAPQARSVHLVGTFNNWRADDSSLMKRLNSGTWVKIIPLPEGKYSYKFVVDGRWLEDPDNNLSETDGLGGKNSLLYVNTDQQHNQEAPVS